MERRQIGNSGIEVPAIGLGCMGMSEFYGASDPTEVHATLERAADLGVTFLDTADMYGHGANEDLIGRFLKGRRQGFTVATKFGIRRSDDPDARPVDNSPAYIRACCEASLRRLGVDVIDLYYMHRRDVRVPIEDSVGAMADLVAEGKILAVGLCEVAPHTIEAANRVHPIAAVQTEYPLWSRDVEDAVLPLLKKLGIALVPYSPLGRGALTGAFAAADELAADDFRRGIPRYQAETLAHNLRSVGALEALAKRRNATPAQVALAWLMAQGEMVIPIPGTRRPERLEENIGAMSLRLTDDEISELDRAFDPQMIVGARVSDAGAHLINL